MRGASPSLDLDAGRIPKSTLLAIARIDDEAEQLAAFEAAKSGIVSVRAAKSIQKGETTAKAHGEARPQDNVKKAGGAGSFRGLVRDRANLAFGAGIVRALRDELSTPK